jgi:hypothetical protein
MISDILALLLFHVDLGLSGRANARVFFQTPHAVFAAARPAASGPVSVISRYQQSPYHPPALPVICIYLKLIQIISKTPEANRAAWRSAVRNFCSL